MELMVSAMSIRLLKDHRLQISLITLWNTRKKDTLLVIVPNGLSQLFLHCKFIQCRDSKSIIDGVTQSTLSAERLRFNLSSSLQNAIESAKRNIDILIQDVEMNLFTFDKFGKEDIKALKFSPDSFIQIAIQMAFIR